MRLKKPAARSIGLDADPAVLGAWAGVDIGGRLEVYGGDAVDFLRGYDWQGGEFVYCDPPYLFSVRRSRGRIYAYEFGDENEHRRLLTVLRGLPCMVAVSGYLSPLYSAVLEDWRHIDFNARLRRGGVAREFLWMNYPEPLALHDYRYLGSNYREREKIARQRRRWRARLERMSSLQRYALLSSIADLRE